MTALRVALLADGAGDRALLPILTWALRTLAPETRFFEPEFEVRHGLLSKEIERVTNALLPDILFVHRDAERELLQDRLKEFPWPRRGLVRVVPVRMTEAWLLIDEGAIRKASGNPNGSAHLDIPRISRLEGLSDPKKALRELLLEASEHTSPRRRQRFQRDIHRCVHLVAEYTQDFSPLRRLEAYRAVEDELRQALSF